MNRDHLHRDRAFRRLTIGFPIIAAAWLTMASTLWATPVQFVPIASRVSGPPYPTGALTADIVVDESGTPRTIDRFSSSIGALDPIGAVDWFVADSFSFGVEREMKESGEKGGTADINIGVGELQECTISKSMDASSTKLTQFAINGNSLALRFETDSPLGLLTFLSEFTTPQPAAFTDVSVVERSDGRSFDLNFALLYSARYDPALPILNEVMTGDFAAIPEPTGASLLICAWGGLLLSRRRPPF